MTSANGQQTACRAVVSGFDSHRHRMNIEKFRHKKPKNGKYINLDVVRSNYNKWSTTNGRVCTVLHLRRRGMY